MDLGRILRRIGGSAPVNGGRVYFVEILAAGKDLNGFTRSAAMLKAAAGLFEGRPLKVLPKVGADGKPMEDHQGSESAWGREVLNTFGTLRDVRFDPSAFDGAGGIVGSAVLFPPGVAAADEVAARLDALEASGDLAKGALGLSFSGLGEHDAAGNETIESVDSVDLVTFPAAGGRIGHRLAASHKGARSMNLAKLIAALAAACPALAAGITPESVKTEYGLGKAIAAKLAPETATDLRASVAKAFAGEAGAKLSASAASDLLDNAMGLLDQLRQTIEAPAGDPAAAAAPAAPAAAAAGAPPAVPAAMPAAAPAVDAAAVQRTQASMRTIDGAATRLLLERACAAVKLPTVSTVRLLASVAAAGTVLDEAGANRLAAEKLAEVDELARERVLTRASVTLDVQEKQTAAMACLFSKRAPKPVGCDPIRDFHGSFNRFLQASFGIDIRDAVGGRHGLRKIAAAVDATNLNSMFDDGMNRALLAEYRGTDLVVNPWRQIVNITSESDFRTKEVIASTWYSEVPEVVEGAAYTLATTPTDRVESYALAKRGFIETITWEKMLNDDLGAWQSMLSKMARSARETLNERVFTKIRIATQPTMSDTYKLTSASRTGDVNLGTAVLSGDATGWGVLMDAMILMSQIKGGGGKAKGIRPAFIVIPFAKAKALAALLQGFDVAATDFPTRNPGVMKMLGASLPAPVIDSGASNTTDWFLLADPQDAEVLRVAFLGGKEEPEVFLANGDTFGSMFTNDRIEAKLRHVYGVAAVDYAGIFGNDAAS